VGLRLASCPRSGRSSQTRREARTAYLFKRQELPAVPLTSNPNALVMAVQKRVVLPMEMECMTGVPHEQELIEEAIVAEHRILKELFSGAIDTSTDRKVNLSASLRGGVRMT